MVGVVPVEVDAEVALAAPVGGDLLVGLVDREEVLDVLLANVFHTEIVHAKRKGDGAPSVRPEARSEFTLVIAFLVEALFEELLDDEAYVR